MEENNSQHNSKASPLHQLEMWMVDTSKKVYQIPASGREAIVNIGPWIALIVLIISLPAALAIFGLTTLFAPLAFMGGYHYGGTFVLSWIIGLACFILQAIALPGLFHRKRKSWEYLFYAGLLGGIGNIITLDLFGIVASILGLYIIFQVRDYYK